MSQPPPEIASDPRFKQVFERREEAAESARAAQRMYRRLMLMFIVATALAAVVGGLVLYGADPITATEAAPSTTMKAFFSSQPVHAGLRICQAVAVGVAAFGALLLNTRNYAQIWRENREQAEAGRCELARAALDVGHAKGSALFRAAGDYVIADLIEGQIVYLTKAIGAASAGTARSSIWTAAVLAVAAGAPILGTAGMPQLVLFGALAAVVTPALLSGLRSWAEATGNGDRAKLHAATRDLLRNILRRRDCFDTALASNDLGAARAFLDDVCAALRTDVKGFLAIMGNVAVPAPPTTPASQKQGSLA